MPWREIGWSIVRGCVRLAIVAYILSAIDNRNTGLIVGVLGVIYARLQAIGLGLSMWGGLQTHRDEDDVVRSTVGSAYDGVFLIVIELICIVYVFTQLPRPSWMPW